MLLVGSADRFYMILRNERFRAALYCEGRSNSCIGKFNVAMDTPPQGLTAVLTWITVYSGTTLSQLSINFSHKLRIAKSRSKTEQITSSLVIIGKQCAELLQILIANNIVNKYRMHYFIQRFSLVISHIPD